MDQRTDNAPEATIPPPASAAKSRFQRLRQRFFHLSPVNRRRLERFKSHKVGYRSFLIFSVLFLVSLFAEFIANERPLIVSYRGEILFPVLVDYPEEKFGGFLAITDYRTPDIANEINTNGWMLWPPIRYSYSTINKDYRARPHRRQWRLPWVSGPATVGDLAQAVRRAARPARTL